MAELLAGWPAASSVLAARGMACVGCAMARFETVGEAAVAYGFDPQELLREVAAGKGRPHRSSHHSVRRGKSS